MKAPATLAGSPVAQYSAISSSLTSANRTVVATAAVAARPVAVSSSACPVCRTPLRPRIACQRSAAACAVPGLPSAAPSNSSSESQPRTSAGPSTRPATARAFAFASRVTNSLVVGAVTASSSRPLTTTSGSTPESRSVRSRAGEALARTNRI